MSFREKSAWISLVTVFVCFGVYFAGLVGGLGSHHLHGFALLHLFLGCVTALVVLQMGLHWAASRLAPDEARAPLDERERLIQLRSHTVGYYVLMVGALATFIPGHLGFDVFEMMNFNLLAVVVAALAVSVAQIVMFRRGG